MRTMAQVERLNTPSQRWARQQNACLSGRRRLGTQSIGAYWQTATHEGDLYFIAARAEVPPERKAAYSETLDRRYYLACTGRWSLIHARRSLLAVMEEFGATIPGALL